MHHTLSLLDKINSQHISLPVWGNFHMMGLGAKIFNVGLYSQSRDARLHPVSVKWFHFHYHVFGNICLLPQHRSVLLKSYPQTQSSHQLNAFLSQVGNHQAGKIYLCRRSSNHWLLTKQLFWPMENGATMSLRVGIRKICELRSSMCINSWYFPIYSNMLSLSSSNNKTSSSGVDS